MALRVFVFAAAVLPLASSCDALSRIGECKRFVNLANPALSELQALRDSSDLPPPAETYHQMADRFRRLSEDIERLALKDQDLQAAVAEVKSSMEKAAEDCQKHGEVLARVQTEGRREDLSQHVKETQTRMAQAHRSYRATVHRVNALCQPRK